MQPKATKPKIVRSFSRCVLSVYVFQLFLIINDNHKTNKYRNGHENHPNNRNFRSFSISFSLSLYLSIIFFHNCVFIFLSFCCCLFALFLCLLVCFPTKFVRFLKKSETNCGIFHADSGKMPNLRGHFLLCLTSCIIDTLRMMKSSRLLCKTHSICWLYSLICTIFFFNVCPNWEQSGWTQTQKYSHSSISVLFGNFRPDFAAKGTRLFKPVHIKIPDGKSIDVVSLVIFASVTLPTPRPAPPVTFYLTTVVKPSANQAPIFCCRTH